MNSEIKMVTASKKSLTQSFSRWLEVRGRDIAITFAGLLIAFLGAVYVHFLTPPPSSERHSKVLTIQPGTNFSQVSKILEDNGIIRDRTSFYLLARLEDSIPKIKAGEYEFNTTMTPHSVLKKMVRGEVIKYPITIPEGFNLLQVGEVLGQAAVCSRDDLLKKASDSSLIKSLGFDGESLEGYLFPDTYNFPKMFGEENVIHQMITRFKTVYAPLAKRAEELGLTCSEVVTLASMVEKEAVDDQERRIIAAVFLNRLNRGMALQSDPTAIYGVRKRAASRITREDVLRKTPYNTYHFNGLPPGPIANPGLKSMQAVLYPADVNYLYFVAMNDRTHYFSSTLAEHNRAVARYQRKGKPKSELKKKNESA